MHSIGGSAKDGNGVLMYTFSLKYMCLCREEEGMRTLGKRGGHIFSVLLVKFSPISRNLFLVSHSFLDYNVML